MITTLDKFGRIIIPKRLRKTLGIDNNTTLNISDDGKRIIIEKTKEEIPIIDKDGILIYTGKLEDKNFELTKSDRKKRMRKLLTNK
jgi:AbrB family transcriptional regulator, transcriptional pleiotropic regulator of transition state genes